MIVVITGPTGVGKTKMSVELAKWLNGIIINADAVQIYKYLDIGSAKITSEEKEGIEHYMLDIKDPNQEFNVKDYQDQVRKIINANQDKNIIMVGGTGLYICGALMNYQFLADESSEDLSHFTNDELYHAALKKDPNGNFDKNNRIRLERFLKRTEAPKDTSLVYNDIVFIGLTTDRNKLYEIINKRVDKMFELGLVNEVKNLYQAYPNSLILKRAIGYKEVISYLNHELSLVEAKELIKKNSRHYAKRQYTWFNNKMPITWFDVNYDDFDLTINEVKNYIKGCQN